MRTEGIPCGRWSSRRGVALPGIRAGIWPSAVLVLAGLAGTVPSYGQAWQPVTVGSAEDLNAVWFVDRSTGWVVGNGGTLRVTVDGGANWTPVSLTGDDLLDVAFRGASVGLIVGDNGRIYHTVDSGVHWAQRPPLTGANLTAVAFGAAGLAYAAGRDGTILRSADDGVTWEVVETGVVRYRRVAARGTRAWVVGEGGAIRATQDGGATWTTLDAGMANDLKGVSFVDRLEGWVVGQGDTVLHTADGGLTWAPRNAGIDQGLDGVYFGNALLGWAVGDNGGVFATRDGGQSWRREPSGTAAGLNRVHFVDPSHGWTAGPGGTLLARSAVTLRIEAVGDTLAWEGVPGITGYDVVAGDLAALRSTGGELSLALDRCLAAGLAQPAIDLTGAALPDSAWFLVRPGLATGGSYDSGSFSQQGLRDAPIAGSGLDCF